MQQNPPVPAGTWDWTATTYDQFAQLFQQSVEMYGNVIGTDNPDLSGFKKAGGKLIIWQGMADQLIFPQGTHARPSEERGDPPAARFKTGVAHVAEALQAPGVPFGLAGTEEAMPPFVEHHRGLVIGGVPVSLRRRPLAIAFGPPQQQEPADTPQQFAERLERLSYALAAEAAAARDGRSA